MIRPNEHLLEISRIPEHMHGLAAAVRLDRNERVTPFSDDVFREMLGALQAEMFCAYPDPSPLYERLSRHLGLPEERLYLTNGSDAAIRKTFQTYLRPGDAVVFPDPTYAMYAIYARMFRGNPHTVSYDADRRLDARQLLRCLQSRPRLLALANPDQPTGASLDEETVHRLAAAAKDADTLFMVDEAYYPFHPHTVIHLVREFDNLIVTRTFSKVGGLAGLRLGYLAAHPRIVTDLQRIRGAHEVNAVAIAVASCVLDHPDWGRAYLDEVEAGRRILREAATEMDIGFPSCPTNFQLLEFRGMDDTGRLVTALRRKGFLVKGGFSHPSVRACIRVTLGGPKVMGEFAAALRTVLRDRQ